MVIAITVVLRLPPTLALPHRFLIRPSKGLVPSRNCLAQFYHRLFTNQRPLNHHVVKFQQPVSMQKPCLTGVVAGLSVRRSGPRFKNGLNHVEYAIRNVLVCLHRTPQGVLRSDFTDNEL